MNDAMTQELRSDEAATIIEQDGWEFAIIEIMGFRKHAGRCREVERFGAKLLRVDIPIKGDPAANGWETHFYSGSSLFSYTPTDEDSVLRANKPYEAPARYRLPAQSSVFDETDFGSDDHDDHDSKHPGIEPAGAPPPIDPAPSLVEPVTAADEKESPDGEILF